MRIENTSPRQYGLSAKGFSHVEIPAAVTTEYGTKTNGFADVDPEMVKAVKAEPWGAAVFGCGDLVEVAPPVDPELTEEEKALAEEASKKAAAEAEASAKAAEEEARLAAEKAAAEGKPKGKPAK